jgi:FkbM family methyltransferase
MKRLIRQLSLALGLYESLGVLVAKMQGFYRGIRISRDAAGDYRVRDRAGRVIVINKRHAIYLADMVLYFDFFFGAVTPDAKNEVHFENPAWQTLPGFDGPVYFTSLAESASTLDLYQELVGLKPGDVVLDVGAYCGLSSIGFARRVGEAGRVYAFEPDPENFAALQKNRESFGLKNLSAEKFAIWKESGTLEFQADGTAGASVGTVSGRRNSTVQVNATTLGDFAASQALPRIDLIKIDAEGSEADILLSSRALLRQFRPALIVELHPVHDVMTTEACQAILKEEGYEMRIVPQPGTSCPLMVAKPVRPG